MWAFTWAPRATKHTARAVGRSMVGMVSVEHHLWLTLTYIKEKDREGKRRKLDASISNDVLFGDSVTTIVEKFHATKQQSATFRQLIPRRSRETDRKPPLVRSHSSSSQCPCEVQRCVPQTQTDRPEFDGQGLSFSGS